MLHRKFTDFSADIDLSEQTPVGSGIKHLPCFLVVEAAANDVLSIADCLGNLASWAHAVANSYTYRLSPSVIKADAGATAPTSITCFWQPER